MTLKQGLYLYAQFLWGVILCVLSYLLARHAGDIVGEHQLAGALTGVAAVMVFVCGGLGFLSTWVKISDLKGLGL